VVEASSVVGGRLNLVDGPLRGAGQVVAFDLPASVVGEISAAGGLGQDWSAVLAPDRLQQAFHR
jgi:hypothetical protein